MARGQGGRNLYLTHWHGGAAFVVKVLKTRLVVYTSKFNAKKSYYEPDKEMYRTPFKEVWIPTGFGPGGVGSPVVGDETGNSILAHIDGDKHVYIGHDVMEFDVPGVVEAYYSEVSPFPDDYDTPRGYIVTRDHVYTMNDTKIYRRSLFAQSLLNIVDREEKPRSKTLLANMKRTGKVFDAKIVVPFSGN
jgi:hypothetical protein